MVEIESVALKRLQEIQKRLIESTPELRSFKKNKPKFLDQSKESPPTTSNSGKRKKDSNIKASDSENRIAELKKLIQNEKDKSEQMMHDMQAREERYLKREKEYRKTLLEYENELRARSNYNGPVEDQYQRNMEKISKLYNVITDNISHIQKKTSQILAEQEKDIKRQFNSKMKEVSKELEIEKKKKIEGVENYAETESQLTRELDIMKKSTESIALKNYLVDEENKKFQKEFNDKRVIRNALFKELATLKRENAVVMEEIAKYKESSINNFTPQKSASNSIMPSLYSKRDLSQEDESRCDYIIQRLKKILDTERKNLKNIRNAYARDLQNRTELEQILRQCADEVKSEITQESPDNKKKTVQLTSQDREKIIEMLLSKETVLELLNEKNIPSQAITREKVYDQDNLLNSSNNG